MEVTALCIRLLMTVLLLLCARDQKVDSAVLHIKPNRLQFFEYEAVTFHCEGLKEEELSCKTSSRLTSSKSSCAIKNVFLDDSGEYWCEGKGGKKSNSVNITVTNGSVILESPVLPVTEGDVVTLSCREKNNTTSSNLTADFYKDGVLIRSSSTGEMTIHSVSKSDEGLYKCHISGAGGSPESWMAVREETAPTSSSPTSSSPTSSGPNPWIVTTVLLMVLLLVVGLLHLCKGYGHRVTLHSSSAENQTVSVEASAADEDKVMYAAVTKNRKKKDEDTSVSSPIYYTLGPDDTQQLAEPGVSTITAISVPSAGANPSLTRNALYSTVQLPAE